eukprot:GHUV01044955.1.p1 GENE.GHUV01044955.1~~GHUV01044955.1.p1  ORF type:complete len:117 (+),score=10.44 GHUV01044955.1:180-530(+)
MLLCRSFVLLFMSFAMPIFSALVSKSLIASPEPAAACSRALVAILINLSTASLTFEAQSFCFFTTFPASSRAASMLVFIALETMLAMQTGEADAACSDQADWPQLGLWAGVMGLVL